MDKKKQKTDKDNYILKLEGIISQKSQIINQLNWLLKVTQEKLIKSTNYIDQKTNEAQKAIEIKQNFFEEINYDLTTPLNEIAEITKLLLLSDLNQKQNEYLNSLNKSFKSLSIKINQLIKYNYDENNKDNICNSENFNLRDIIDNITETIAFHAFEKDIEVESLVKNNVFNYLKGDAIKIIHVLTQLGKNAVQFTEKGYILIVVELENESQKKARLKFSVEDTGVGIPGDKKKILSNYFKSSLCENFFGSGLAGAKRIIKLMNGKIGVNSIAEKGSQFWFTLELEKQTDKDNNKYFDYYLNEFKNLSKRILIIDYSEFSYNIIKEKLSIINKLNVEFKKTESGIKFLHENNNIDFDIIIIDQYIFEKNNFFKKIETDNKLKKIHFIIMISNSFNKIITTVSKQRNIVYIFKPLKQKNLIECINNSINYDVQIQDNEKKSIDNLNNILNYNQKNTKEFENNKNNNFENKFNNEIQKNKLDNRFENKFENISGNKNNADNKGKKINILVAEDNQVNQRVINAILSNEGYDLFIAENGIKVIDALKNDTYNMILMDVQMPEMDGIKATEIIRKSDKTCLNCEIPIIALTANATEHDLQKCIKAGMNGFITKPFKIEELKKIIKKYCDLNECNQNDLKKLQNNNSENELKQKCTTESNNTKYINRNTKSNNEISQEDETLIFNKATFLARLGGNVEIYSDILNTFIDSMPEKIHSLKNAIIKKNLKELEETAHSLKGSAAVIEAHKISSSALKIEKAAKDKNFQNARLYVNILEKDFEKFIECID